MKRRQTKTPTRGTLSGAELAAVIGGRGGVSDTPKESIQGGITELAYTDDGKTLA